MFKNLYNWFIGGKEVGEFEPAYKSREIWSYTHIDPKTKRMSERPVLVFRRASEGMFWGLPLTRTTKGKALYVPRLRNGKRVSALSQMRTLKAERLVRRLGKAEEKEFTALSNAVVRLLVENDPVIRMRNRAMPRRRVVPAPQQVYYPRVPAQFPPVYILQPR